MSEVLTSDLKSPQYGSGTGGNPFDDSGFGNHPITRILIRSGTKVDAIQVTYGNQTAPMHGSSSEGRPFDISLAPGEQIIAVFGRSGAAIDQIGFVTQLSDKTLRRHGPFGGTRGNPFYIIGKALSFFGRSGSALDAVGVYVEPPVLVSA